MRFVIEVDAQPVNASEIAVLADAVAAAVGLPVESDATLRQRQSRSTSLPAQSVIEAIFGAVVNGIVVDESYDDESESNAPCSPA